MENKDTTTSHPPTPAHYEIRLSGEIDEHWTAWFDGLTVRQGGERTTVITGPFADQAALHGVLQRVRDLGMPLISVLRFDDLPASKPSTVDKPIQIRQETS